MKETTLDRLQMDYMLMHFGEQFVDFYPRLINQLLLKKKM